MKEYAYKNLIGKKIRITSMDGEPSYNGKKGVVQFIDDMGQLHGSWGGLAVIPQKDSFEVITEEDDFVASYEQATNALNSICDYIICSGIESFKEDWNVLASYVYQDTLKNVRDGWK